MDCAHCKDELASFLYGESDDLVRASVRRHVDGCASCRAELERMGAAREAFRSAMPATDPPAELDARALEAAARFAADRRASASAPRRTFAAAGAGAAAVPGSAPSDAPGFSISRVVSWLGSMAMRPQVAMALLLVLMVGVGLWYLPQARRAAEWMRAEVAADHDDEPSELAAVDDESDGGASESARDRNQPLPPLERGQRRWGKRELITKAANPLPSIGRSGVLPTTAARGAVPRAGTDDGPLPVAARVVVDGGVAQMRPDEGAVGGSTVTGDPAPTSPAPTGSTPEAVQEATYDEPIAANLYARAMNHYRAGRYGEAIDELGAVTRRTDAASLVPRAYLNLARSHRAAGNLPTAARTYETLLSRYPGFGQRSQAMWEAAVIYRRLGQLGRARALLERLVDVASHSARARRELVMVNQGERAAAASTATDPASAVEGGL